ncbi:MAG: sulfatase-like hydrolase/transferase, partial [Planctomycetota bacterium]|nr:sulfatase-like hydrolase/transferase [Planctomycetota bacterium]
HFPFQAPGDIDKEVNEENWMQIDSDAYIEMLENLDTEVGRILDSLDAKELTKNTLVVFASDNGGFEGASYMGALRGAKGSTLEGGIRVPMIARWPGKIEAGIISKQVCASFDLTYSFLRIAGVKTNEILLDGIDIIEHLTSNANDFPRTLFWRGRRGERTWTAIRDGDHKMVTKYEDGKQQAWLYDLSHDEGEANDLRERMPGEFQRLVGLLQGWEKEVSPAR